MGKLSDIQLRSWVKSGNTIAGRSDGAGLTFTLSSRGTATWVLRYHFGGKQREITLGRYPDLSLKDARRRATEERVAIANGKNVALEKRREKIANATAGTFKELAEDYLVRVAPSLALASQKETKRYLKKDIYPRIGGLRVKDITSADVVHLIEVISKRSPSVARRTYEIVSVIFSHGVAKQIALVNPCDALRVSSIIGVQKKRRERIKLTSDEIRSLLAALPTIGIVNALAIRILLATCVRKGELIQSKWKHIDIERGIWLIPDDHAKGGKGFSIPLAPTVVRWFLELKEYSGRSDYILPSRKHGRLSCERPICNNTLNAALNRLDCDIQYTTPHDLRSTARSYLAELGVDIIVAERCLNHSLGGLVAVYDQHDYMEERRRALELWAEFIESSEKVNVMNVVPIRKMHVAE